MLLFGIFNPTILIIFLLLKGVMDGKRPLKILLYNLDFSSASQFHQQFQLSSLA
jgi:hypothetical protein